MLIGVNGVYLGMSKNIIALHVVKNLPHYLQCSACSGWFDPYHVAPLRIDGSLLCLNCVDLAGMVQCDGCNDLIHIGESVFYKTDTFCEDCAADGGLDQCSGCNEWSPEDDTKECDDNNYCEHCRERYGYYQCADCKVYIQNDTYVERVGECYCEECFNGSWAYCANCEEIINRDDLVYIGDDYYCEDCQGDVGCDSAVAWGASTEYADVGSQRCYGVELETSGCPGWGDYSHGGWQAKDDMTVLGMEFYSRILQGNKGLSAVDDLCEYADNHNWAVDSACGFHIHLDMRNESIDGLKAIAFAYHATYGVWKHFACDSRVDGNYNKPLEHRVQTYLDCNTIAEWDRFASGIQRRYQWANWRAYADHKTLEIRLLEGSLDAERIKNWIRAHTVFCDWSSAAGVDGVKVLWGRDPKEQFSIMRDIWSDAGCYDLNEYYVCGGLREYECV